MDLDRPPATRHPPASAAVIHYKRPTGWPVMPIRHCRFPLSCTVSAVESGVCASATRYPLGALPSHLTAHGSRWNSSSEPPPTTHIYTHTQRVACWCAPSSRLAEFSRLVLSSRLIRHAGCPRLAPSFPTSGAPSCSELFTPHPGGSHDCLSGSSRSSRLSRRHSSTTLCTELPHYSKPWSLSATIYFISVTL